MFVKTRVRLTEDVQRVNYNYLAGIIDGEGTIGISTRDCGKRMTPYISISNTNKKLIDAISSFLRKNKFGFVVTKRQPKKSNHKLAYGLTLRYNDALRLAKILQNKLIVKPIQAKVLVFDYKVCTPRNGKYTKQQKEMKSKLIAHMHKLNSRGV